jgi:leucyl-tRNA synthetase
LRDRIEVSRGASEEEIRQQALSSEKVQRALGGRVVRQVVFVPGRLMNLVSEEEVH